MTANAPEVVFQKGSDPDSQLAYVCAPRRGRHGIDGDDEGVGQSRTLWPTVTGHGNHKCYD